MLYTVTSPKATLRVASLGAEMKSLVGADGVEYLWQADPALWGETSPILFPYIGRLWNGGYRYRGRFYPLPQHGFASKKEFSLVERGEGRLVLSLVSDEETRETYPFDFAFFVEYVLKENVLFVTYRVENRGEERMYFGLGGHPGFRVPLLAEEAFEDYEIRFDTPALPSRVGFTPQVFLSDRDEAYPLQEDTLLPLRHDLFDEDAVILKNAPRGLTLASRKTGRGVRVEYPAMPYLGIWHWPKTKAEYVCIEPWCSLPSRHGVEEEISAKSDLLSLGSRESLERGFTVTLL